MKPDLLGSRKEASLLSEGNPEASAAILGHSCREWISKQLEETSLSPVAVEKETASFLPPALLPASSHLPPHLRPHLQLLSWKARVLNVLIKQHLDIFQMCSPTSELAGDFAAGLRGVLLTGQAVVLGRLCYVINGPLSFNRSLSQDTVCYQRREFPEVFASHCQACICTRSQREQQDGEALEGVKKKGWALWEQNRLFSAVPVLLGCNVSWQEVQELLLVSTPFIRGHSINP